VYFYFCPEFFGLPENCLPALTELLQLGVELGGPGHFGGVHAAGLSPRLCRYVGLLVARRHACLCPGAPRLFKIVFGSECVVALLRQGVVEGVWLLLFYTAYC